MSLPVLIKVYGNLCPVDEKLFARVQSIAKLAQPAPDDPAASFENGLLRIAFEGICFPVSEILAVIGERLRSGQNGKLDEIDIEEWRLTRYIFENGQIIKKISPLNNVLAFSGH